MRILLALCLIALSSYGCGGLECGAGTQDVNGQCKPIATTPQVGCSTGTRLVDNQCVATISCGENTRLQAGQCVGLAPCKDGDPMCTPGEIDNICAYGRLLIDGICQAPSSQFLKLPFSFGENVYVSQGFHGNFSHNNNGRYALDFPIEEGTPVVAARAGTVVAVRSDSDTGCGDESCANQANYIIVDHGDGTFARYYHLRQDGAKVAVGEGVCPGQLIGETGNTGFSSAPHLHFDVIDSLSQTLPLYFNEIEDISDGIPFSGQELTSNNNTIACEPPQVSQCWGDLFLHRGVRLDTALPCGHIVKDKPYKIKGQSLSSKNAVMVGIYSEVTQQWDKRCVQVDAQGYFEADLVWPMQNHTSASYFMLSAANGSATNCGDYEGWSISMRIWLQSSQ